MGGVYASGFSVYLKSGVATMEFQSDDQSLTHSIPRSRYSIKLKL